jgi:hypothetical protein
MGEVDRFSEVLDGYSELTNELLAAWTAFLTGLSTTLGAGSYGPAEAASDFPAAAKLAVDSMIAIASEAVDAVSILTSSFSEEATEDGVFAKANTDRILTPEADFVSVTGEVLAKSRITFHPAQLPAGKTDFELKVDGDGVKARTYDGWVVATDSEGHADRVPETVTVG